MRPILCALFALMGFASTAQLDVPARIVLDGQDPVDRQVTGLANPVSEDAGMSLEAVRSGTTSTAYSSGSSILQATLEPPLAAYGTGLIITLIPDMPNSPGAQLDLNGLGPRPLVKWGGTPLDSADLIAGSPTRLIYDGGAFQVVGEVTFPCPGGFSAVTNNVCVMDSSLVAATFYVATTTCAAMNARLCSFSEWARACRSQPGFLPTVLQLEWVDDAANSTYDAKQVGQSIVTLEFGCEFGAESNPLELGRYRCCKNR
ncbi:MAG: hypothetical protein ABI432_12520 [Flavobacteriales bacterium]